MNKEYKSYDDNLVIGRNSVSELLSSGREVERILVESGNRTGSINVILAKAKQRKIPIKEVNKSKLDSLCANSNHQGIAAYASEVKYCSVDDILNYAKEKDEAPFIIICDQIEDPHNLGAIIRTAECVGAHGVIIPARHSCGVNFAVAKAACGAIEYMKIARVTNLVSTIKELKEKNIWVYAADMDGVNAQNQDFKGAVALVVGSEGNGVSRLVKENCDVIVKLEMKGKITSLNASVAAGVLMYEILKSR
ncbi:MAG: 23S rRNA (guanosine(2251)-2'-O)-methyltransferase RlmB [Acutalibacteraceae bacterium]|nr:23S rRNA (guanosine(2251)-2'-O)-methyltransferase RlmB [Acutalibacteraceae bacterium]